MPFSSTAFTESVNHCPVTYMMPFGLVSTVEIAAAFTQTLLELTIAVHKDLMAYNCKALPIFLCLLFISSTIHVQGRGEVADVKHLQEALKPTVDRR